MTESIKTAIALRPDQSEFDSTQLAALRQIGVSGANRADLAVFFHQCRRTGLDPFARQIYMIKRMAWNPETRQSEPRQTIQTGIDGFRLIARRACDRMHESLEYEDTMYCGPDGEWKDVWLKDEPPHAAKVVVLRDGRRFPAVALFREYRATKKTRVNGQEVIALAGQWADKPAIMIGKCAEALALRKAFPQDLSGLYTDDEMDSQQAVDVPVVSVVDTPSAPAESDADNGDQPATPDADRDTESQSGSEGDRDWDTEIATAKDLDALNHIWTEMQRAGAKTAARTRAFGKRGRELAPVAKAG